MTAYETAPDIEEMDDLLARAICAGEFGEVPTKVVVSLAAACYAYTDAGDKENTDLWVKGSKVLDHLRNSLKQRGVDRDLTLRCFEDDVMVYAHTIDCAASGIAARLGARRHR